MNRCDTADKRLIAIVKGDGPTREIYSWIYDEGREKEVLRMLGRFATNEELSFSWYDAACISQKIRECG